MQIFPSYLFCETHKYATAHSQSTESYEYELLISISYSFYTDLILSCMHMHLMTTPVAWRVSASTNLSTHSFTFINGQTEIFTIAQTCALSIIEPLPQIKLLEMCKIAQSQRPMSNVIKMTPFTSRSCHTTSCTNF